VAFGRCAHAHGGGEGGGRGRRTAARRRAMQLKRGPPGAVAEGRGRERGRRRARSKLSRGAAFGCCRRCDRRANADADGAGRSRRQVRVAARARATAEGRRDYDSVPLVSRRPAWSAAASAPGVGDRGGSRRGADAGLSRAFGAAAARPSSCRMSGSGRLACEGRASKSGGSSPVRRTHAPGRGRAHGQSVSSKAEVRCYRSHRITNSLSPPRLMVS